MGSPRSNLIQLEDFLYDYPDINDPSFSLELALRKEFNELKALANEPFPERGDFFRHQKLIHRFMLAYDRVFLIHRTGTGKTCAAGGSSEIFKRAFFSALTDYISNYLTTNRSFIKKVYVISSKSVTKEFRRQIQTKCSLPGEYVYTGTGDRRGTSELKKFYSFQTFGSFSSELNESRSDMDFIEKYSNCMFIFDEAHNMIPQLTPEGRVSTEKDESKKERNYKRLVENMGLFKRIKIILMTATPMQNSPSEIAWLMNILLPPDFKMDLNANYDELTISQLEPYFRGKISFVRETDVSVNTIYRGRTIATTYEVAGKTYRSYNKIYLSDMAQSVIIDGKKYLGQKDAYMRIKNKPAKPGKKKGGGFRIDERQASIFMFPDGGVNDKSFKKYFVSNSKDNIIWDFKRDTDINIVEYLQNNQLLRQLSSKFLQIIDLMTNVEISQNTFVYSPYVNTGAIIFGKTLETRGWERLEINKSIFRKNQEGTYISKFPLSDGINVSWRYAIIESHNSKNHPYLLEAYNSYENRHSELIRCIIVTPVGGEGINLKNVLQIHMLGPEWNEATIYQAISRGIRALSHEDLRRENPDEVIDVNVYLHASILPKTLIDEGNGNFSLAVKTSDISLYEKSEKKDIRIRRVERIMKQTAIDCLLHRDRNILPEDRNFTPSCDYDICNYPCFIEPDTFLTEIPSDLPLDYSSYDVLYSGNEIAEILTKIGNFFLTRFTASISELSIDPSLSVHRSKLVILALYSAIQNRRQFSNRFGMVGYLYEQEGVIYLLNEYPNDNYSNPYSLSVYTQFLNGMFERSLAQATLEQRSEEQSEMVDRLLSGEIYVDSLDVEIKQLIPDKKIELFEKVILAYMEGNINVNIDYIYRTMAPETLFNTLELSKDVTLVSNEILEKYRGKNKEIKLKPGEYTLSNENVDGDERIYFHILGRRNIIEDASRNYNDVLTLKGINKPLRIYKPSEGVGWRNSTPAEKYVYGMFIQNYFTEKDIEKSEQFGNLYGLIINDRFKIVDNRNNPNAVGKKRGKGRVCKSIDKPILEEIIGHLYKDNPEDNPLLEARGLTKKSLCEIIRQIFEQRDQIVYQ